MKKYVELEKRQNKVQEEFHKKQRILTDFNTGTRDMKSEKDYDRAKIKRETRKAFDDGER